MPHYSLSTLPKRYADALRAFAVTGEETAILAAPKLGAEALAGKLSTLEMAKIHGQAVPLLISPELSPQKRSDVIARSTRFFNESQTLTEELQQGFQDSATTLHSVNQTLDQRLADLAKSKQEVQREMRERQSTEAARADSRASAQTLLDDSLRLESQLKDTARQILTANEEERKRISIHLQDEIAQTLIGINLQLLALRNEVTVRNREIAKEITVTQRLVEKSAETIREYSRQLGLPHES